MKCIADYPQLCVCYYLGNDKIQTNRMAESKSCNDCNPLYFHIEHSVNKGLSKWNLHI